MSYRIGGAYLEFAPVTFPFPGSATATVTIEAPVVANPDESAILLRVEIEGAFTQDEAIAEASAVATSVADRLVYERGSYLPTPTMTDMAFDVDGVKSLGDSFNLICRGVQVNALGQPALDTLIATASRTNFPGETHLATLRAALGCDDPIGKFLCLYGILMTLAGDDQKKIDTLIEKHEPGQVRTPRPDKPDIMETPYTRLRNEVAHRLKTRTVGAIHSEMEQRLPGLTTIVRKAIKDLT